MVVVLYLKLDILSYTVHFTTGLFFTLSFPYPKLEIVSSLYNFTHCFWIRQVFRGEIKIRTFDQTV